MSLKVQQSCNLKFNVMSLKVQLSCHLNSTVMSLKVQQSCHLKFNVMSLKVQLSCYLKFNSHVKVQQSCHLKFNCHVLSSVKRHFASLYKAQVGQQENGTRFEKLSGPQIWRKYNAMHYQIHCFVSVFIR
jgi:hypothetical protein